MILHGNNNIRIFYYYQQIQWLDGTGREFRDGVQYTTDLLEDNHREDARSTLSFVATKEHHNTLLTCTSSNPAINQPLSTQVYINDNLCLSKELLQMSCPKNTIMQGNKFVA